MIKFKHHTTLIAFLLITLVFLILFSIKKNQPTQNKPKFEIQTTPKVSTIPIIEPSKECKSKLCPKLKKGFYIIADHEQGVEWNYQIRDPDFLKILTENYNADITALDFKKQTELSRTKINKWVEKQTKNKIKELLKPGMISKETDLVLTNAIYFKGNWLRAFNKKMTRDNQFQVSPTQQKSIPFMRMTSNFRYSENSELQYLQLPYQGNDLIMEVLLPKPGVLLSTIEQKMDSQLLTGLTNQALSHQVVVSLPKLKAESELNLGENLSTMGMTLAFNKYKANFRGIRKLNGDENIYISSVIHKAYVDINEEGTEAAAATAVVAGLAATGSKSRSKIFIFKADRPFLFFIRHLKSGVILFMGRYSQP